MMSLLRKPFRLILGLIIFWGFALHANAEDFTFNVPVEFHNIHPNVKSGFINVEVYTKDYVPTIERNNIPLALRSRITYGSAAFQLVNGEFVGTLVIKMNAPSKTAPGKRAQDAYYYEVSMAFQDSYYEDTAGIRRMKDGTYGYDTSKPFVYWTSGLISPLNVIKPIKEPKRPPIIKH